MTITVNREAWKRLLLEDLAYLRGIIPSLRDLEGQHIKQLLQTLLDVSPHDFETFLKRQREKNQEAADREKKKDDCDLVLKAMREVADANGVFYASDFGLMHQKLSGMESPCNTFQVRVMLTERPDVEYLQNNYYRLRQSADLSREKAHAFYQVVRAMHDGHCPKCGRLSKAEVIRQIWGYSCPHCKFEINDVVAQSALKEFQPYLEQSVRVFEDWLKTTQNPSE